MGIMAQPTEEQMKRFITRGERATWPHVEAIRQCMAAEMAGPLQN